MRVLHVISGINPRQGGPTAALIGLAEAQRRAGLDVSVISSWQSEAEVLVAERLRKQGIRVTLVGPVRSILKRHPDMRGAVEEEVKRAQVVHVHALWEEIQHQAALAATRLGVPYIMRPCGMLDPWCLSHHALRKKLYMALRLRRDLNGAAAIHYTTADECEGATRLGLRAPVIIEPLGLDLAEFKQIPEPGTFRRQWPTLGNRPYVIFYGRICCKKGLDLLVPAFAHAAGKQTMLVIAGPDDEGCAADVRKDIQRHGLEGRVLFTGMLRGAQRVAALAEASLFALPSRQENFGISVAEAMACGCPVVVSNRVNIYREIRDAGAGSAVELDVAQLAGELRRWLTDDTARQHAGQRARDFAHTHYDWDRIAAGWGDHYEHLAAIPRPALTPRMELATAG